MLLIGLTGSIATGKSSVSLILHSPPYQLPIIDADILARRVVEPGTSSYKEIVAHFSPIIPDLLLPEQESTGGTADSRGQQLNRQALGKRVFGDDPERKRDRAILNGIVHPAVRREIYKEILYYFYRGHWAVVLDVPLLFESGLDMICGTIIVVAVSDPTIQMHRLRVRNPQLSAEDAEHRVQSQGDVREKARRAEARGDGAGVVIWNDGTMEQLEKEVGIVMKALKQKSPQWWAWLLLLVQPLAGMLMLWSIFQSWRLRRKWESELKLMKTRQ
jgi:dephospho-CoA kinase